MALHEFPTSCTIGLAKRWRHIPHVLNEIEPVHTVPCEPLKIRTVVKHTVQAITPILARGLRLLVAFFMVRCTDRVTIVVSVTTHGGEGKRYVFVLVAADGAVAAFRPLQIILVSTETTIRAWLHINFCERRREGYWHQADWPFDRFCTTSCVLAMP
jgi:hypothetical protein